MTYKDAKRRNDILKSVVCDEKISFSTSIVEYNRHMSESNENVQQQAYYSSHRLDCRYWWSLFIFLLNAIVLNAYKLWDRFNSDFKLTHSKFQHQIVEALLTAESTRKQSIALTVKSSEVEDKSLSCEWEYVDKKFYCEFCRKKKAELRKRRALEKISENLIKRRRTSQINWRCSSHDLCCKKKECWRALHSNFKA
jgi:hypothetical protein